MSSKDKKDKPVKTVITDKDHPSLIEVGGQIRLRVLEDFNIEQELPKWVRFKEEWSKVKKDLGFDLYGVIDEKALERKVKEIPNKTDAERESLLRMAKALLAMDKAVKDDQWDIRKKHEREVDSAILKNAKFVKEMSVWEKARNALGIGKKVLPVEVAMGDLMDHLELTSTPELEARLIKLNEIEAGMRKSGQYTKADKVKELRTIVAGEAVVCKAGFTSYVLEDTMIDFLRKSERGVAVDFLRYYEDEIPQEAVDKKITADKLMVFDNYVVAHYSNLIAKAAAVEKKQSAEQEKKERVKRRDPILFGVIKNSRKLYYICDWVTDTDDLTLEKLEKELGVARGSLVTGTTVSTSAAQSGENRDNAETLRQQLDDERRFRNYIMEQLSYAEDGRHFSRSGSIFTYNDTNTF